ncbi:MAG: hypothetical protein MRJ96_15890 [Nitrospirales bacterium]|nr:hypothetical protein [Nitrospirales bacterium]
MEIELPSDWYRFRDGQDDLIFTKHGLGLQQISVSKKELEELNEHAKKTLTATMLPHEVAQWSKDGFLADTRIMNQRVLTMGLAQLAGHPGYRLLLSFKTTEGLTYRILQYGYLHDKTLTRLTYRAVSRIYFDEDLPIFEQVVASYHESHGT